MSSVWPFDQAQKVAALTTSRVLDDGFPILRVVHYLDDEDWAFTCGTTNDTADLRVIAMEEALALDATLAQIADLPPGWGAFRSASGGKWERYEVPGERVAQRTLVDRITQFFRRQ
jgi:hypothetical protein